MCASVVCVCLPCSEIVGHDLNFRSNIIVYHISKCPVEHKLRALNNIWIRYKTKYVL